MTHLPCEALPLEGAARVGFDAQARDTIMQNNTCWQNSFSILRGQFFLREMSLVETVYVSCHGVQVWS